MSTAYTCPLCGATSHNPEDERHGYCARCRGFTGDLLKPWSEHRDVFLWFGPVTANLGRVAEGQPPLPQVVQMLRGVVERLEARIAATSAEGAPAGPAVPEGPAAAWPATEAPS